MSKTVLILGGTGRFGRHASAAFSRAGWQVRQFDRASDTLRSAVHGVQVIVNAWNPAYPDWAALVPKLHDEVIAAAKTVNACVIVPGNVYVYGAENGGVWSAQTAHRAENPLGKIRREMEQAYRDSGVQTILLRAGDFIDTEASGNWFDAIITKSIEAGKLTYPGRCDVPHAWAFLPDLGRAAVALAERRESLSQFEDVPYAGYTMTGEELQQSLSSVLARPVHTKAFAWWALRLARPFWKLAPHLLEMSYLWNMPHQLEDTKFKALVPEFVPTDCEQALAMALAQTVKTAPERFQNARSTQTIL